MKVLSGVYPPYDETFILEGKNAGFRIISVNQKKWGLVTSFNRTSAHPTSIAGTLFLGNELKSSNY